MRFQFPQAAGKARQGRFGFTLAELLVVIAIIVVLMSVLLPALAAVRTKARELKAKALLSTLSRASDGYFLDHASYPGYLPPEHFTTGSQMQNWTGNENLVLSLLGGVTLSGSGSRTWTIPDSGGVVVDLDAVGEGPKTATRSYGAYFSPKPNELVAVTGTRGADNEMPEIIDPVGGMPLMYFRGRTSGSTRAVVSRGVQTAGTFVRYENRDYLSPRLTSARGKEVDQTTKSLIYASAVGGARNADLNLAWMVTHSSLSEYLDGPNTDNDVVRGAYMLLAAGKDGVYMNGDDLQSGPGPILSEDIFNAFNAESDDIVEFGGSR